MDFFAALEKRARDKDFGFFDYSPAGGIRATIEALKEMTVGEPINTNVRVRKEPLFIWDEERGEYVPLLKEGKQRTGMYGYVSLFDVTVKDYLGIDGEEVVVMVFKKP